MAVGAPTPGPAEPDYVLPGTSVHSPVKLALIIVALGVVGGIGMWFVGEDVPGPSEAKAEEVLPPVQPETLAVIRYAEGLSDMTEGESAVTHRREIRDAFEAGKKLSGVGKHAEAVPYFLEAVKLDRQFAEAHYRLGLAYVHIGKRKDARKECRILQELDPDLASLLLHLIE